MARRQRDKLISLCHEHWIRPDKKCTDLHTNQAGKSRLDVVCGAGLQNLDALPDRASRRTHIIRLAIRGNRIIGIHENTDHRSPGAQNLKSAKRRDHLWNQWRP
jgi:hypothetical protein